MIRYAPLHFFNAINLYILWQLASRGERVIQRGHIINKWFGQNRQAIKMHNTKRQRKFLKLHAMFTDFVTPPIIISEAEKKLEAMFEVLEKY
jgi:cytidylate kinase